MNTKIKLKDKKTSAKKLLILILGPIFIFLAGIYFYFFNNRYVSTDDAYIKLGKISISSEVQGKIKEIFVNDNSHVKKGQICV